jgi:hypothetical protein
VFLNEFFVDIFLIALKILKVNESDGERLRLIEEIHFHSHSFVLAFKRGGDLGLLVVHHQKYQVISINYQE